MENGEALLRLTIRRVPWARHIAYVWRWSTTLMSSTLHTLHVIISPVSSLQSSCCQVIDLPWFVKEADRNWGNLLSMPQFPRPKSNFIWTHMKSYEMLKHFEALRLLGLRNPMQFMQHFFSVLPGTSIHVCAKPSACLSVVKLKPQSARSCATGSAYHLLACLPPSCC